MYRVYWSNHWYYAAESFETFEAAAAYGRKGCFEFAVHQFESPRAAEDPYKNRSELVYGWSPIGGGRFYGSMRPAAEVRA